MTIAETKNALVRKLKAGRLTAVEVAESHARLDEHVASGYFLYFVIPDPIFRLVASISLAAPVFLRTADALHLGMTQHLGADLGTFDDDLRAAAQARGMLSVPNLS